MKKLFVGVLMVSAFAANAQTNKPAVAKKPATTSTTKAPAPAPKPVLKNLTDSASYAIGISVANFYTQQGMEKINAEVVAQAIKDVIGKKTVLMNDMEANNTMMKIMTQAQENKAAGSIKAGRDFLAQNKNKPGVKTTESGLQYEVLQQGTGVKPNEEDSVTVNYVGTLLNGEEFDNSYKRGEPITFPLNQVIRGWTEGVQLMPTGSKYKFYIPHELAYGTRETGNIPAGSVLIFEVELLKVNGK